MRVPHRPFAALLVVAVAACDSSVDVPEEPLVEFSESSLQLGPERSAQVVVRNVGSAAVGPVDVVAGPVERAGIEIPGVTVSAEPGAVPTLNPGDSAIIDLEVSGVVGLQPGTYEAELRARTGDETLASASLAFEVLAAADLVGSVQIEPIDGARQGDAVELTVVVRDTAGAVLPDVDVTLTTLPGGRGLFTTDGAFVPYAAGDYAIVAHAGSHADTLPVQVAERGVGGGTFTIIGHTDVQSRFTSDTWVWQDLALSGTWSVRAKPGNTVYAWDITGTDPVLTDSVTVSATVVNDVKIRDDGTLAVMTQEHGGHYAVTLLDLTDPHHPVVAGEFRPDPGELSWIGVHNVWIDGDYVYLVTDGVAPNRGLWIIDASDPAAPERVATFYAGSSFLHDVYVRDGLAFLSHWNSGLVILDVGNGIMGGSPTNPVELSRIHTAGGETHNAWYWPEAGYVFVGEEDFFSPGYMHVVDVSDLENPREVASFRVPGDTPHNFWLDEERGILYMAWYSRGLQAVDVTGRLAGALDQQGRTIASFLYDGPGDGCPGGFGGTCTWAPQLHEGFVFVSDMNTGVWKLQPDF